MIIGANDDGSLSGLKVTDELMRNIAGIRADGLLHIIMTKK
nr:hypothetical protein [uncultured Bacteroides sp.]